MLERPRLRLFGVPELQVPGLERSCVFTSERPFQALAFLAAHPRWVTRDELGLLLWPDREAAQARSNLRKVLLLARRFAGADAIEQQGDRLRWTPHTDLQMFEAACDSGRFAAAVELGSAPFLHGMEAGLSADRGDWILFERKRLQERWQAASVKRLEELAGSADAQAALASLMLRRDPLDEAATTALACAQRALGSHHQALATLHDYARRLRDELAVEPSLVWHETVRWVEGGCRPVKPSGAQAPPRAALGPAFIGRRGELAQIRRLLADPACRLLALTGFAGMGKTALARTVCAQAQEAAADAAVWVPLEDLNTTEQVAVRIVGALGVALANDFAVWTQLAQMIGQRSVLLVLDNAEHLPLGADLASLLAQCPHAKVLATSRMRLDIEGEWVLPLDGLPLPDEGESDVDVLRHCDAVRLFEARALPFLPAFDLAAQAAEVCTLVRMLGGSPLALGLAAAWVRVLPVADIVAELATSLELLDSGTSPKRGLRAGFDQAWQRLLPVEQQGVARLAHLPGDFTRAMAQQVGGVALPVLASLVDKSFLRCDEQGRFSLHPLIRQWSAPREADRNRVLHDHAAYIGRWLARHAARGRRLDRAAAADIDVELAHVRAAAQHAIDHLDADCIVQIARPLADYYERRGLWSEGLNLFGAAVQAMEQTGGAAPQPPVMSALAHALRSKSVLEYRAGRLAAADVSASRLVAVAGAMADRRLLVAALNIAGLSAWQRGDFENARDRFQRALPVATDDHDAEARSSLLCNLALVDKALGRYAEALAAQLAALEMERAAGDTTGIVISLNNIANLRRALAAPNEAVGCLNEALALCDQESLTSRRPFILVNLGLAYEEKDDIAVATRYFERSLTESRRHGEPFIEANTLLGQARLDVLAGHHDEARRKVGAALAIADRMPSAQMQALCVLGYGGIVAAEGRRGLAAGLMCWAIAQPALNRADRDRAERWLAPLKAETPEKIAASAPLQSVILLAQRPHG